ncbi:MAG: DUF6282 family protein [Acidobacteriota bacterium]|nr:DUF6282 family protein [Acidobacteriota bacterium]
MSPLLVLGQSLNGIIDIHVHSGPDSIPRKINSMDLARQAKSLGMRGLVLKNHYESTAAVAYLVRQEVPGIEVFGGVDLNLSVGGMNPAAVEHMAKMEGGFGKVVWMASFDEEAQVRYNKENRPSVSVSKNGQLLPEVKQVIATIAKYNLVMATGHPTAEEALLLIREARRQGVKQIVVTHAMIAPIHMNLAQMQEAAKLGAYVEFVYNGLIGSYKEFTFADYAKAIRGIGVEHAILSSDLGQVHNPQHMDGWKLYLAGMKAEGFSDAELARMTKENPAQLLGLQ